MFEGGKVKPHIYETFFLEEASTAHMLMESSTHMGKIILKISGKYLVSPNVGKNRGNAIFIFSLPLPKNIHHWHRISRG